LTRTNYKLYNNTMEKKRFKIYEYTAVFQPAPEGGYSVIVPALPGCISEGDSFEEALSNIKEAIELYLEESTSRNDLLQDDRLIIAPVKVKI